MQDSEFCSKRVGSDISWWNPWVETKESNLVHSIVFESPEHQDFDRALKLKNLFFLKKNNFIASFYGWGSTATRLEPLQGGSLLFTTKFPEIPGTYFIDLRKMKGWVNLEPLIGFEHRTSGLGIQCLNH